MIAEGFVRNGANVFISSRDEKTISAVAAALTAVGPGTCTAVSCTSPHRTPLHCTALDDSTALSVLPAISNRLPRRLLLLRQFAADLSNLAGVEVVSSRLRDVHGLTSLHVLVNNSGASWGEPLETFSEKGWSASLTLSPPSLRLPYPLPCDSHTQLLFPLRPLQGPSG